MASASAAKKKAKAKPFEPTGIRIVDPEKVNISDLNLATYNPRKITREKMNSLKASILKHGLVLTLVVQKKGMIVVGGHQRLRAMREVCEEKGWEMPTTVFAQVLDIDDSTAKQLNVTLNNVEGEFDPYKLGQLFADVFPTMVPEDILATGFATESIEELIDLTKTDEQTDTSDSESKGASTFSKSVTLSLVFETVEQRDKAKAILDTATEGTEKKPGTIVLSLLRGFAATSKKKK